MNIEYVRVALYIFLLNFCISKASAAGDGSPGYGVERPGSATFYGGGDGGNCGYGSLATSGYSRYIAAGAGALWKGGRGCGACYKVKCVNSKYCKGTSLIVTIVDLCPGGICCDTCEHFDLSDTAFNFIANLDAGVIPLVYQRVPCSVQGPIKFQVVGNPYWINVLPTNVAGPGDITEMYVKPANRDWLPMTLNWGINFVYNGFLQAPLSFRVVSGLDGQVLNAINCLGVNWGPGTYQCGVQFTMPTSKKSSPPPKPLSPFKRLSPPEHHSPPLKRPPKRHSPPLKRPSPPKRLSPPIKRASPSKSLSPLKRPSPKRLSPLKRPSPRRLSPPSPKLPKHSPCT